MRHSPTARRAFVTLIVAACCLALSTASAEPIPAPQLDSIFPLGGKIGTDVEVAVTGEALEGAQQLIFSNPGITASPVMSKPDRFYPDPRPVPDRFIVHIAPDVPGGFYELRLANRLGVSAARGFFVGSADELVKRKPNNAPGEAMEATVNSVVNAVCTPEKTDYYRFAAKKGQKLILHCTALGADTRTDPVLSVFDDAGKLLDEIHDALHVDPTLEFTAPEDRTYTVSVHDYLYDGGPDYGYRLSISSGPWIDFVDPPFATAGTSASFTVYGRNLPGGTPAPGVTVNGRPVEKLEVTIQAPNDAMAAAAPVQTLIRPVDASVDFFAYQLASPTGSSNAVRMALIEGAMVPEQEPNDKPEQAQALTLPAQVLGHFNPRGDHDWYSFEAKKGQKLWIEVVSHRLGTPTDPALLIQQVSKDASGKTTTTDIAEADDVDERGEEGDRRTQLRMDDPALLFTAPVDATYRVLVRDLYEQGDPSDAYLLIVRPPRPDFSVLAYAARPDPEDGRMVPHASILRKGSAAPLELLALRREGFAGEIHVAPRALPPGVSAVESVIGPGANLGSVVLQAAPDAADWTGPIELVATATTDSGNITRPVRPFQVVQKPVEGSELAPARLVQQLELAVRGDLKPPFSISAGEDKVLRMARGGKLQIPISITRAEGFNGEIRLSAHGLPEHVRSDQLSLDAGTSQKPLVIDIDPETLPGTFSFVARANAQISYVRSPEVAAQRAEDKKRIDALFAELTKAAQDAAQKRQQSEQMAQEAVQRKNQAEQQRTVAEQAANSAAAAAKQAADKMATLLAAVHDAPGAEQQVRAAAVDKASKELADLEAKAKAASDALATATQAKKMADQKADAAEQAHKDAVAAEARARDDVQKGEEARRQADEQFQRAKDAANPRDVRLVIPSRPIVVQIVTTPFTLTLAAPSVSLKAGGGPATLAVQMTREFGFAGEVRFELRPPPNTGGVQFADKGNQLDAGQTHADLVLKADPGATVGAHVFTLHARYRFNDRDLEIEQPLSITVAAAEKQKS